MPECAARHLQVGENQWWRLARKRSQGLGGVLGRRDRIRLALQRLGQPGPDVRLVVDDQDRKDSVLMADRRSRSARGDRGG